ncbi:hypothetical protein OY671_009227, partial [Metschnikowia pulcherrima]
MAFVGIVVAPRGLVGTAEADEVGGDDTMTARDEIGDETAIEVAPARLAVHEQHRRGIARAFVEMVDSQARTVSSVDHLAVMRRKIKAIQAGKAFVR